MALALRIDTDKWNGTESPEKEIYTYIFNSFLTKKKSRSNSVGKRQSFQQHT